MDEKTPGVVLFEYLKTKFSGDEQWDTLDGESRVVLESGAQAVLAHANPWLDRPTEGEWLVERDGLYHTVVLHAGNMKEPRFSEWCSGKKFQRIIGPTVTKQSLSEG